MLNLVVNADTSDNFTASLIVHVCPARVCDGRVSDLEFMRLVMRVINIMFTYEPYIVVFLPISMMVV